MKTTKYKISIVSYINSLPFVYGIENSSTLSNKIILSKDIPSVGAEKFKNNSADIALVPIGALPDFDNYKIVTDYCIGTKKQVDSVLLLSNVEIKNINNIFLDYHSRTSVQLIKILSKYFWKINPKWDILTENIEKNIQNIDSVLIIGDRAFEYKQYFKYHYDLGLEWNKFTNLPFAFAVWVSRQNIDKKIITDLNNSLKNGVQNIDKITFANNNIDKNYLLDYLKNKIDYSLNSEKKTAINKYLELLKTL